MSPPLSATEVAFAMLGVMQALLALAWAGGAWHFAERRHAALGWAAFAAFSAAMFALVVAALRHAGGAAEWLHAAGDVCGVLALLALQRGVRSFTGRAVPWRGQAALLALVLAAAWAGLDSAAGALRVLLHSAVLVAVCLGTARDLRAHARDALGWRWPALLSLPLAAGAVGFGARGLRALLAPASVGAAPTGDGPSGIGMALGYLVLTLALHATLVVLVVTWLAAELRHRSRHDALTGLPNRRAMDEALAAQLQRSLRNGEPFTLMMVDIDHLESINERHGHAVGDAALVHLAGLLREGTREVDRVARYGGEEFAVLLPEVALADARRLGERLRERVGSRALVHGSATLAFTVSIGMAEWWPRDDLAHLLARAEAALRRAKHDGRDRVEAARDQEVTA